MHPRRYTSLFFLGLAIAATVIFSIASEGLGISDITGENLSGNGSFDTVMRGFLDAYGIPGASLAVSYEGRLILARGYGFSTKSVLGKSTPVEPGFRFRIASLSKPITACAIMQLVEEGKISLDSKAASLLGDSFPSNPKDSRLSQITVRHLLEHRGGFDRELSGDPMFLSRPPGPESLKFFLNVRLDFTPGERFAYSNFGYCILGRIIERISQQSYEFFIKEHILGPTGARSFEIGSSIQPKPDEVIYYDISNSPPRKQASPYGSFRLEAMDSHGGWIGTAVDYVRFLNALDGRRKPALLKADTYASMLSMPEDPTLKDKPTYYAKGFWVRKLSDGGVNVWHTGYFTGTMAFAAKLASGYTIVALFNGLPDDNHKALSEVDKALGTASRSLGKPPSGDLFPKY